MAITVLKHEKLCFLEQFLLIFNILMSFGHSTPIEKSDHLMQ